MTPKTLKYLKGVLTERFAGIVEELPEEVSEVLGSSAYVDLLKTSQALKEVNRAIRRAENRAKRKQDHS